MAASRRTRGGAGGMVNNVVWFLFVACVIVAFFKVPAHRSTDGLGDILVAKSQTVKAWVIDTTSGIDLSHINTKLFR